MKPIHSHSGGISYGGATPLIPIPLPRPHPGPSPYVHSLLYGGPPLDSMAPRLPYSPYSQYFQTP